MQNRLRKKLKQNYDDVADFARRSGIPLSHETISRVINRGGVVSAPSIILICKYLGFTASEIKNILERTGDKDFSALIGEQKGPHLTEQEKSVISIYRCIKNKRAVEDHLALVAKAEGLNISSEPLFKKRGRLLKGNFKG